MRFVLDEEAIAACLSGELAPELLNRKAEGAVERVDDVRVNIHVREMRRDFVITSEMLIRLCVAALERQLSPVSLSAVAFAIIASDHFEWHDELVGEVLHDWSSPDINYPLSRDNLERFRAWLSREEPYGEKPSLNISAADASKIISTTAKVSHR